MNILEFSSQDHRIKHEIHLIAKDNILIAPECDLWTLYRSLCSHYDIFLAQMISIKDNAPNI